MDIDGTEYRMVIVQSTIPDKQTGGEKQIFETYLKVGNMFQTEKKNDKDSDYDGKLNFPVGDKKVWFRSKVSNQGNKFTAVSMAPPRRQPVPLLHPPQQRPQAPLRRRVRSWMTTFRSRSVSPKTRLVRSAAFLGFVRQLPCLVCGTSPPVHAHHITYAEPSGMGRKVGDNWTVPFVVGAITVCTMTRGEKLFWADNGIDPMDEAMKNFGRWEQGMVNRPSD